MLGLKLNHVSKRGHRYAVMEVHTLVFILHKAQNVGDDTSRQEYGFRAIYDYRCLVSSGNGLLRK